jgi:hypothetical protein
MMVNMSRDIIKASIDLFKSNKEHILYMSKFKIIKPKFNISLSI